MEDLVFTLNAILPILIPIFLGYLLKRLNFYDKDFLKKANKLVFKILIPILLFSNLYYVNLGQMDWLFVGYCSLAVLVLFFIGMVCVKLFVPNDKQKGVIHQVTFRSNYAIIGIPLATSLGGSEAAIMASLVSAATVPLFNILAVIALSIYDKQENNKITFKDVLNRIITNPLIIGVFCGLLVVFIRTIVGLFDVDTTIDPQSSFFIQKTIKSVANITTPLALIVLGGQFEFSAVRRLIKQIAVSTFSRLIIVPGVALTISYLVGFKSATNFAILIAIFATPVAVSSAPMAAQMNQDDELAGQLVVWTSTFSFISLFLIIYVCKLLNIF